jgi:chromate reductase, NAD(P)H dehydrogenase (quinone)
VRGLYHLRAVLLNCQAEILTQQCSVARAGQAFDKDGELADERTRGMMQVLCRVLIERARLLSTRIEA